MGRNTNDFKIKIIKVNNIEKYIQFAIDNGFEGKKFGLSLELSNRNRDVFGGITRYNFSLDENIEVMGKVITGIFLYEDYCDYYISIKDLLLSKEFIEAISEAVYYKKCEEDSNWLLGDKRFDCVYDVISIITTEQTIAIRDGKLEDFIKEILELK